MNNTGFWPTVLAFGFWGLVLGVTMALGAFLMKKIPEGKVKGLLGQKKGLFRDAITLAFIALVAGLIYLYAVLRQ